MKKIYLPYGGGTCFDAEELARYMKKKDINPIVIGQKNASNPKQGSLDEWLRNQTNGFSRTRQATKSVRAQLEATGMFREVNHADKGKVLYLTKKGKKAIK